MAANAVGIGILGFGSFAMFAAQQFAQVPGAVLRCIAGTHREASLACAARFGLTDVRRAEVMFAMPGVQLVYIATPPFGEQVYCTALYGIVPVTFYHGFTQAGRMDRQELHLLFERGDVTLREWIPTQAVVRTALDEATTHALVSIFPGARIDVEGLYASSERAIRARHKTYEAYQRITLTSVPTTKMTVYGDLLRAMLADQLAFLDQPSHARVITDDNGRESLRMSVRATQLARHRE